MVVMVTPFKKTKKNINISANFYTKFEENPKTWTYHLFFILHESYINLYLSTLSLSPSLCKLAVMQVRQNAAITE